MKDLENGGGKIEKITDKVRQLIIIMFILVQIGCSFAQNYQKFPMNIDVSDYDDCRNVIDTILTRAKITLIDFEGYRSSYDYSKIEVIDLDFDGNCEILHYFSSSMRGWPHDFLSIYKLEKDSLSKIGDFPSFLLRFAESDGKYLQINLGGIEGEKTNPIFKNTVYKFIPFYSPQLTKSEFREEGLKFYNKKEFEKALTCFQNALIIPHHSKGDLLHDANNIAITLIKLNQYEQVTPLLKNYIKFCVDKVELSAAYYNIGLAHEYLKSFDVALENYKKSCRYNQTPACEKKIKEFIR